MPGRVFAVVGPSGAGKDTLIAAAAAVRRDLHVVRRVITRPPDPGGEPFESVSDAGFDERLASGRFLLTWEAHGLRYAIPDSAEGAMNEGRDVIFNGSRAMLGEAWATFPGLTVIHVTAPVPVLAERLANRGREGREAIASRLARTVYDIPPWIDVRVVENGGALDVAVAAFLAALQPASV